MSTKLPLLIGLTMLGLAAVPAAVPAAITVTVTGAQAWGTDDGTLGVAGGLVEDFEDVVLAPGLRVQVAGPDGAFTGQGAAVLEAVFDPVGGDPYGDAFAEGVWDGRRVLLNTADNRPVDYGSLDYRRIRLEVPAGAGWIGLALQQLSQNSMLEINGAVQGRISSFGIIPTAGRNGYVLITSDDPSQPIVSVAFGGFGDAFVIDHVVFAPVAEVAAAPAAWSAVKALFR